MDAHCGKKSEERMVPISKKMFKFLKMFEMYDRKAANSSDRLLLVVKACLFQGNMCIKVTEKKIENEN